MMTKMLAIIHTTPVTVEPLKTLAGHYLPDYEVTNFVDDSILPQLGRNGGKLEEVEERLVQYMKYAEQVGADLILNACSSVGELVKKAAEQLTVPVVRIDEAMAEEAIQRGDQLAVVATLSTTLNPTLKLLKDKAMEAGKTVSIEPVLAEEAYKRLLAGDSEGHDTLLAETLQTAAKRADVIVLAQASMARAVKTLPEAEQNKFLTSPVLGMERVKRVAMGSEK